MGTAPTNAAAIARAAIARGDLAAAYDVAATALAAGDASGDPASEELRHLQVLALARMGDTERAMALFGEYGLGRSADPHRRAVGARLRKDRALKLAGGGRKAALAEAFAAYHSIFQESGDSFPGINAATLALLSGETGQALRIAAAVLADPAVAAPGDFYSAVTRAEALLVLGRAADAADALAGDLVRGSADHGARSTARRQLGLIADHFEMPSDERARLLEDLAPPAVIHFAGHMFAADAGVESELRAAIDLVLDEEKAAFGYGSLACGADLLFAEALLERGGELHVVLPFADEDFLAQSVRPGGEGWVERHRACLAAAASVTRATSIPYFGDPAQYGYCSRIAMGLARLRAEHLGSDAVQIVLWDGVGSSGPAGTGADVAAWVRAGGRSRTIAPGGIDRALVRPAPSHESAYERVLAAILFTDFAGFSKLPEQALPAFWDGVMRLVADVLDEHGSEVACRNAWGDALYAVTPDASAAAEIALELQARLADFDYSTLGLGGDAIAATGGMRVGAHYGSAWKATDRITGRTTFYGTEVSRAARIEPVTPPGAVFVTEPLAAILALEARDRFSCHYVGRISLAKNYGDYPMYRLARAGKGAAMGEGEK
jgi:adenylate cyclase